MATRRIDLRMTLDEYLATDDRRETMCELYDGRLYAMAPASGPHGRIAQNAGNLIDRLVSDRPPCRAIQNAGIRIDVADDSVFIPDVVMTCEPPSLDHLVEAPSLVVEVLSPSTKGFDKHQKLPGYSALSSVMEIWMIDARRRAVQVWRRQDDGWPGIPPVLREGSFTSNVLAAEIALDELYRLSGVPA